MKHLLFIIALLISYSKGIQAQQTFNTTNGVALNGYDPVSYFTAGKAVEGSKNMSYNHAGVIYYFASEANRNLFKKNPATFEPQYGGWCAYAMGKTGEKVEVDPETFKVINGKLYLFYNAYFNNTLPKWNKDEASLKSMADKNWNNLLKK